eukprot:scaffold47344_cov62-Phaeocystis_antarctica.AAC.4
MQAIVRGCRPPRVGRSPSSSSRSSGSAAARSPLPSNSRPRLPMEASLTRASPGWPTEPQKRWRLLSVSRDISSASRSSGSAAARSPLACSSRPRQVTELSVL